MIDRMVIDLTNLSKKSNQSHVKLFKYKVFMGSIIIFAILSTFALLNTYGKYYAAKYNNGISVASNIYFNSGNLLKIDKVIDVNQSGLEWTNDIADIENDIMPSMPVTLNSDRWTNGSTDIKVVMQNYDNNILFNSADMDVEYEIKFKLIDLGGNGANYSIVDTSAGDSEQVYGFDEEEGNVITLRGSLKGGTLSTHTYKIRMTLNTVQLQNKNYIPNRVLVVAYPTSPDYISESNKNAYLLLGLFEGKLSALHMTVDTYGFEIAKNSDFGTAYKNYIKDYSGFICNIKTAGDVIKDESNAVEQDLTLIWNSKYIDISRYDENYIQYHETLVTEDDWSRMTIKALPYTSINVTYYKTDEFDTAVANGLLDTAEEFNNLIKEPEVSNNS